MQVVDLHWDSRTGEIVYCNLTTMIECDQKGKK